MSAENSLKRLDIFLVENGYASSREIAKKLIVGGYVTVNGKKSEKPSLQVTNDCLIEVSSENEITRFVSRGALKLLAALDSFNIVQVYLTSSNGAYIKNKKQDPVGKNVQGWISLKEYHNGGGYLKDKYCIQVI